MSNSTFQREESSTKILRCVSIFASRRRICVNPLSNKAWRHPPKLVVCPYILFAHQECQLRVVMSHAELGLGSCGRHLLTYNRVKEVLCIAPRAKLRTASKRVFLHHQKDTDQSIPSRNNWKVIVGIRNSASRVKKEEIPQLYFLPPLFIRVNLLRSNAVRDSRARKTLDPFLKVSDIVNPSANTRLISNE